MYIVRDICLYRYSLIVERGFILKLKKYFAFILVIWEDLMKKLLYWLLVV